MSFSRNRTVGATGALWVLTACFSGSQAPSGGTEGAASGTGATGAAEATVAGSTTAPGTTQGEEPLRVEVLEVEILPDNPLAATARVVTNLPSDLALRIVPEEAPPDAGPGMLQGPADATEYTFVVTGLHAASTYRFEAVARDAVGNEVVRATTGSTNPVPPQLPPLSVEGQSTDPDGWTFVNVVRWLGPGFDPDWGYVLALDAAGHPVWVRALLQPGDVAMAPGGRIVVQQGVDTISVLDRAGRLKQTYLVSDLTPPVDTFHHEALPLADGQIVTLSTELRSVSGYDDGMGGQVTYDVVGDVILRFAPGGQVTFQASMFKVLKDDVLRMGEGFHAPFWDVVYADAAPGGTKDWTHGNAVVWEEDRGQALVSLRTLDWIVAVDLDTGDLRYRLGPDGDVTLTSGEWFYHQHAPARLPDGGLVVYDNGNNRPGTGGMGEPPLYTRVVAYDVDEATLTASERWSVALGGYAPFLGNAEPLDDQVILVVDGGLVGDPSLGPKDPANPKFARVSEVKPGGAVTFSIQVGGPDADTSFSIYRGARVAGGYGFAEAASGRSSRSPAR